MPDPHLLVIAVDGLRASALGAYGNTAFATPALDRLAAESFLVDWCFAGSPDLALVYRSLWQSVHVLRPEATAVPRPILPRWFSDRGYATTLVTDEPLLATLEADTHEFDEVLFGPLSRSPAMACSIVNRTGSHSDATRDRADDIAGTSLAQLMEMACECIAQPIARPSDDRTGPQLVWVHSRGMYGPWDAPLELQQALLDEDDPEQYDIIDPPDVLIGEDADPDAAFLYGCAYAAQVMVLDACIDGLMAAADAAWPDGNWLLLLLGTRGFPLGEHGRVGGVDDRLSAEALHVPWLIRFPDSTGQLARTGGLVSHLDLLPTLMERLTGEAPSDGVDGLSLLPLVRGRVALAPPVLSVDALARPAARLCPAWRDAVISAGAGGARSIRTPGWCLRCGPADSDLGATGSANALLATARTLAEPVAPTLYVRPDDRWEANDVAKLCPEVVTGLTQAVADAERQIHDGGPVPAKKLPDELRTSVG
jgi:arylsulfatase A-like enzyme